MNNKIIYPLGNEVDKERNLGFCSYKGTVQIDYIFAISAFIIIFALMMQYTTNYYTTSNELTDIMLLRSDAISLLAITDCSHDYPCLATTAHRFSIIVNNTQENLINQSHTVADLVDELIIFNMYDIHPHPDLNSLVIYYDNEIIAYQRSGSQITFKTDIDANQAKLFTLYLDDDSNFTDRSTGVTGNNNLTEKIYSTESLHVLQYRKLEQLLSSGYDRNDTRIIIYDEDNQTVLDYGEEAPKRGNVIALQKYVSYQNSSAGIEFGRFVVNVW